MAGTNRAYWMTPLVPSSLARGTSLRGLARALPPWWATDVASRLELEEKAAAARKGVMAMVGLTVFIGVVSLRSFGVGEERSAAWLNARWHPIGYAGFNAAEHGYRVYAPRRAIEAVERVAESIVVDVV